MLTDQQKQERRRAVHAAVDEALDVVEHVLDPHSVGEYLAKEELVGAALVGVTLCKALVALLQGPAAAAVVLGAALALVEQDVAQKGEVARRGVAEAFVLGIEAVAAVRPKSVPKPVRHKKRVPKA